MRFRRSGLFHQGVQARSGGQPRRVAARKQGLAACSASLLLRQLSDPRVARYQNPLRHVEKQAMLHDSNDLPNGGREFGRVVNLTALAVENQISFVGDVVAASVRLPDG